MSTSTVVLLTSRYMLYTVSLSLDISFLIIDRMILFSLFSSSSAFIRRHCTQYLMLVCVVLSYCACTVLCTTSLQAQTVLTLDDAVLVGGQSVGIPLRISFPAGTFPARIDSLRVRLTFSSAKISIDSVRGTTTSLIQCPRAGFRTSFAVPDSAVADIICTSVASISSTTSGSTVLVTLFVRGLASLDTLALARIVPHAVIVNGQALANVQGRPAIITVRSVPIGIFPVDALGQNYPNEVIQNTVFPYSIADPTSVRFKMYDTRGKLVYDFPPIFRNRGRFEFVFSAPFDMASGIYFMQMQTSRGIYVKSFMVGR
jgi:hypothetical protein